MATITYAVAASGGDWADIDELSGSSAESTLHTAAQSYDLVQVFVEENTYAEQSLDLANISPAGSNRVEIIFLGTSVIHGGRVTGGEIDLLPEQGHTPQDFTDNSTLNYGIRIRSSCSNITISGQSWASGVCGLTVHGYQDAGVYLENGSENIILEYIDSHNNGTVSWSGSEYDVSLTGYGMRLNGVNPIIRYCKFRDSTQDPMQAGSNSDLANVTLHGVFGGNTRTHSSSDNRPFMADSESATSHSDFFQIYSVDSNPFDGATITSCFSTLVTQNIILGTGLNQNDNMTITDNMFLGAYGLPIKFEDGSNNIFRYNTVATVDGGNVKVLWIDGTGTFDFDIEYNIFAVFGGGIDFDIDSSLSGTGTGNVWNDSTPSGNPPAGSYVASPFVETISTNADFLTSTLTPQNGAVGKGSRTLNSLADLWAMGTQTSGSEDEYIFDADTFISGESGQLTTNYSTDTVLRCRFGSESGPRYIYLQRATMPSIPSGQAYTSPTLKVYSTGGGSEGSNVVNIYLVDTSVVISEMTYNEYSDGNSWGTIPFYNTLIGSITIPKAAGIVESTPLSQSALEALAGSTATLALVQSGTSYALSVISSREGSYAPRLVIPIEDEVVTPTVTAEPTIPADIVTVRCDSGMTAGMPWWDGAQTAYGQSAGRAVVLVTDEDSGTAKAETGVSAGARWMYVNAEVGPIRHLALIFYDTSVEYDPENGTTPLTNRPDYEFYGWVEGEGVTNDTDIIESGIEGCYVKLVPYPNLTVYS